MDETYDSTEDFLEAFIGNYLAAREAESWDARRQEKLAALNGIGDEIEASEALERLWRLPCAPTSPPMGR